MKILTGKRMHSFSAIVFFVSVLVVSASAQIQVRIHQPGCIPQGPSPLTVTWEFEVLGIAENDTPYFYIDYYIDGEVDLIKKQLTFDTTFTNDGEETEEISFSMWCLINNEGADYIPVGLNESCWFVFVEPATSVKYSSVPQFKTQDFSHYPLNVYNIVGRKVFRNPEHMSTMELPSSGYYLFRPEGKENRQTITIQGCEIK
ncbi:MAG: hypothetical protein GF401_06195 [Chitinivibrionales bacterium]|nr:hypothetical protein [Chitinivibrionales bacterium]